MPLRAIGHIIRERRLELGLTQEELAERVSVDGEWLNQADISRIENGHVRFPRPARLGRIAEALGLSLGDLLLYASGVDDSGQLLIDQPDGAGDAPATPSPIWDHPRPYHQLLEHAAQAVIVCNPDGTIRYLNPYAEQLYGWPAAEAQGNSAVNLIVDDASEWQDRAAAALELLARGERWSGELRVRARDGRRFMVHVLLAPVHDREGRVLAIFGNSYEVEH